MKRSEHTVPNVVVGLILFGLCPALGLLLVYGSLLILARLFRERVFGSESAALALALLLVGLGLLQFSYLVFSKKDARISTGVIYFASIAFIALGLFAAILPFIVPQGGPTAYHAGRAIGVAFIGLLGLRLARSRRRQNHLREAMPSERPPAGSGPSAGAPQS